MVCYDLFCLSVFLVWVGLFWFLFCLSHLFFVCSYLVFVLVWFVLFSGLAFVWVWLVCYGLFWFFILSLDCFGFFLSFSLLVCLLCFFYVFLCFSFMRFLLFLFNSQELISKHVLSLVEARSGADLVGRSV